MGKETPPVAALYQFGVAPGENVAIRSAIVGEPPVKDCAVELGTGGITDGGAITTSKDEGEIQPLASSTEYVYVPATNPEIVVEAPELGGIETPLELAKVHVPLDGKPVKTTLPVANVQVGWVIVPTTGAVIVG